MKCMHVAWGMALVLAGCQSSESNGPYVALDVEGGKARVHFAEKEHDTLLTVAKPMRALEPGITYELVQYDCDSYVAFDVLDLSPSVRRVSHTDGSQVLVPLGLVPDLFIKRVVGWVFVNTRPDGTDVQRWLILDDFIMASIVPVEVRPATEMGDGHPAPTTVAEFVERAKTLFNDAKAAAVAAGDEEDRTRYVLVHSQCWTRYADADDCPPLQDVPDAPIPVTNEPGNGSWNGADSGPVNKLDSVQLDGGSVGIFLPPITLPSGELQLGELVGLMIEDNSGTTGTESWYIADDYTAPTTAVPVYFAALSEVTEEEIVNLGTVVWVGLRRFHLIREAATYFSYTFPTEP